MDDVDRKLVTLLRRNARESYTRLAQEVGTSEGTVRARVKKLVEDGVITRFTIRTAGQAVKALIEVRVQSNVHTEQVARQIASWEGVEALWELTGDDDIVVVADCQTPGKLNEIIDAIRAVPGISSTRSRLILKEYG